ncbi:McbB family protein [Pseudomonas sp. UBA4617]|uniref:McbB family protein n=1 Tax=Pseudomonas sp. UBA4617 TaxID=1947318 RepID=UPI0039C9ED50
MRESHTFLESILIIGEATKLPYFQEVTICIDWKIPNTLKDYIESTPNSRIQITNIYDLRTSTPTNPTLYVFAYSKLKPEELRTTYSELSKNNSDCGISVGFVSHPFFHLTEPYIPSIGNPCAFCTLDRLAHYENLRASQHHWSRIWSFCQSNKIELPRTPLDELQSTLILGNIVSFTNKFTSFQKTKITQDQFLLSRTLNLSDGSFTEDSSIHWPLCQCIGEAR